MKEKHQPSYYGIIPATVRYDNNLPPRAILLYSEITALSNKEGYCFASNEYFAELYGVHKKSISRLISSLQAGGHVEISVSIGPKGTERRIYPIDKKVDRGTQKRGQGGTKMRSGGNKNEDHNNKVNKQTKEGTKKAKELAQIIEKNTKRLIVFCNNDKEQLKSMVERALFKGDPLEQIPAFVEHNCDNFMFRSSPESFFIRKFTQWLRYAKGFNRKKRSSAAPAAYNDILGEYYEKELDPKYLKRAPERYKGFATEYTDKVVRMDVDRLYGSLSSKNKTYTPYFIYDVCYGSLAAKAGTRPDRRFSKFKQWYEKLTDYRKNQDNLRQQFQKHLSK